MKKPSNDSSNHSATFPGFPPEPVTNYWPYPKVLNGWWHILTPWEQKVLDYILRHTWGYKKDSDSISLSQFINGITKKDGTIIDKGTGIKDERTIRRALVRLGNKGFILREPVAGKETLFKLRIYPSQEMIPPTTDDTPPLPQDVGGNPSQEMSPTIKDISIKDTNNIILGNNNQEKKFSSIKNLTKIEFEIIAQDYDVPVAFVISKYEDLQNYCASKGKIYKNYLAALRNFVKQDAIKIRKEVVLHGTKRGWDARNIK